MQRDVTRDTQPDTQPDTSSDASSDAPSDAQHGLRVEPDGWVAAVRRVASPHCDARPADAQVTLVVVHCISLPPGRFGGGEIARFFAGTLDRESHPFFARLRAVRVSSHFLIERDGSLTQFVSCRDRAWHAGLSAFSGQTGCNDFSIGVELEGCEYEPFVEAQYATLASLLAALRSAYPLRAVRGHSEVAPGRKSDPGPLFDWSRLRRDFAGNSASDC